MISKLSLIDEAVERTALPTQVYQRVLNGIVEGRWQPGQRLNIEQIARDMQVSITPVREAFVRLASQRLVQFEPYKGYSVLPAMNASQITELFDARSLLEVGAVRAAVEKADAVQVASLRETIAIMRALTAAETVDYRAVTDYDQAFHLALVAASGNSFLASMYEVLIPLIHIARLNYARQQFLQEHTHILDEHEPIVEAFSRRDPDMAEQCLRQHLRRSWERVNSLVASNETAKRRD